MPAAYPPWETRLGETFALCGTALDHADLRVSLYGRTPAYCADEPPGPGVHFDGGLVLTDTLPLPERVPEIFGVGLLWHTPEDAPAPNFHVALHIMSPEGDSLIERGYDITWPGYRFGFTPFDVSGLEPGDYPIEAAVTDGTGNTAGTITVATITR